MRVTEMKNYKMYAIMGNKMWKAFEDFSEFNFRRKNNEKEIIFIDGIDDDDVTHSILGICRKRK